MINESMSSFWGIWIAAITLGVIAFCFFLLAGNHKTDNPMTADGDVQTTGHTADGIEEYDNPLPRWWFMLFVATIIFALVYLALYPGLGQWKGLLGWSSTGQWEQEMAHAEEFYAPIFDKYAAIDIQTLSTDPEAMKVGERIFVNNCSVCHGSAAKGGYGFPNLTDDAWLYGGDPETIRTTIIQGRNGLMPAWVDILGEEGVTNMTQYVMSLSGAEHNAEQAAAAKPLFAAVCSSCHGADGKGSAAHGMELGAPNLTDNTWLYKQPEESLAASIEYTLRNGRNGLMPSQARYLDYGVDLPPMGELSNMTPEQKAQLLPKLHLVAAYVYSLSNKP